MQRTIILGAAAMLLLVLFGCDSASDSASEEEAVRATVLKEAEAHAQESAALLREVYHEDAVAVQMNGTESTTDDITYQGIDEIAPYYEAFWSNNSEIAQDVTVADITVSGETATCIKSGSMSFKNSGGTTETFTISPEQWTLTKFDTGWLVTEANWQEPE